MSVRGTNIAAGAIIAVVNDAATFTLSTAATGRGSSLALTAAGVTLINCNTGTLSPNVSCSSTAGLVVGMGISGVTTNPGNSTVFSITDSSNFVLSANVVTGAS
ncbi:MAG: hypothetical protein JWO94_144, partial [Verrucomicrobiaceae bacterium]|nr:hypothetical protein [Verrucomicrobiaceae bacterium]